MKKAELLAPAGNYMSFRAAVENGADAVYLGGPLYNARKNADNFTMEEIREVIREAHGRGVKVYLALNTLLKDSEMKDFENYAYALAEAGADAFIVQDPGAVYLLREAIPEMVLHASTQAAVHNAAGASFYQKEGFGRVVLARENTLEEIRKIKSETDIELEIFVHGALCISYSGLCLMSSFNGGRSGNRGNCAQPCRKRYELLQDGIVRETEGDYLLSPRDLCLAGGMESLLDCGVSSLKIEGRMKRPEYVAAAVGAYRKIIDDFYEGNFSKTDAEKKAHETARIFNRGYTKGFFHGRPGKEMMSFDRPNNRGTNIGTAGKVSGGKMEIVPSRDIHAGDCLEVRGSGGLQIVRAVEDSVAGRPAFFPAPPGVRKGSGVRRVVDGDFLERMRESCRSTSGGNIAIDFCIRIKRGKPVEAAAEAEGLRFRYGEETVPEEALRASLDGETVRRQFSKLGDTFFEPGAVSVEIDGGLYLPIKKLNEIRRHLTGGLEAMLLEARRPEVPSEKEFRKRTAGLDKKCRVAGPGEEMGGIRLAVTVRSPENLEAAFAAGADFVYLDPAAYRNRKGFSAADLEHLSTGSRAGSIWIKRPAVIFDSFGGTSRQGIAEGFAGVMTGNFGGTSFVDGKTAADYTFNVMNGRTACFLRDRGFSRFTFSPEMSLAGILAAEVPAGIEKEMVVWGRIILMRMRQCIISSATGGSGTPVSCGRECGRGEFAVRDERGSVFPVFTDGFCQTYILSPEQVSLTDSLPEIMGNFSGVLRLDTFFEDSGEVSLVTDFYRRMIDAFSSGGRPACREILQSVESVLLKEKQGNYRKGVI